MSLSVRLGLAFSASSVRNTVPSLHLSAPAEGVICVWSERPQENNATATWIQEVSQERMPGTPQQPYAVQTFANDLPQGRYVSLRDLQDARCNVLLVSLILSCLPWSLPYV